MRGHTPGVPKQPAAHPTGTPLFEFEDVTVHGEERDRLHRCSASLPDDGVTAVLGASGSGKSTLLRLCNRLLAPDVGVVRYRGVDLRELDPLALRRIVGLVLQRPVAFAGTVRDNLLLARPLDPSDSRLADVLNRVALPADLLDRVAVDLSGGELQRLCVARTLLTEPSVLLLDEPTSSLDERSADTVESTIHGLVAEGLRAVWVTHDEQQAARVATYRLLLDEGSMRTSRGEQ